MFISVSSCFVVSICVECGLVVWVRTKLRKGWGEVAGRRSTYSTDTWCPPSTQKAPRNCGGVCFGLKVRRQEAAWMGQCRIQSNRNGNPFRTRRKNFPQVLAFCVTYAKSLLCFFKVTQPRYLTVFILCNKGGGPSPSSYVKKKEEVTTRPER